MASKCKAGRGLLRHMRYNYGALPLLKIQITTLHVTLCE